MLDVTSDAALSVVEEELDMVSEMVGEIGPKLEKKKDLASELRDLDWLPCESMPEESLDFTLSTPDWSILMAGV